DFHVTGVQTCALPISSRRTPANRDSRASRASLARGRSPEPDPADSPRTRGAHGRTPAVGAVVVGELGRANVILIRGCRAAWLVLGCEPVCDGRGHEPARLPVPSRV